MKKPSLVFIAFLQAMAITVYVALIGLLMWGGNSLFGTMNNFLGPTLFLLIFVLSVIICTLLFGYYPFILWSEKKQTEKAVRVVLATTGWLVSFGVLTVVLLILFR